MTDNKPKELLPTTGDYIDTEGDIHHPDDNPEGFAAEGVTPRGGDFSRDGASPVEDSYYEEVADAMEIPGVAVDLGFRAVNLLLATDSYAKASMLKGFIRSNNRRKIAEYGGETAILSSIKRNNERGRQALRAASGIDAMLANPYMVPDENGFPYSPQQAEDDLVATQYHFRQALTSDGVRSLENATALEKIQKGKEIDRRREELRRNLARQVIRNKAQS